MSSLRTMKIAQNALLTIASCALVLVLAELLLRHRYAEPQRTPSPEILAIQPHLELEPDIGFRWNTNVSAEENIVFNVADVDFPPLSTDQNGFINHPRAVAARNASSQIDILGLGDSFMEHAAHHLFEFFESKELSYHSMAIHRQAPPHYNQILIQHALPKNPKWIIYGLFENDFEEAADYDSWNSSGLDWFTYHSGTWCGPPLAGSPIARFSESHLRGFEGLTHVLKTRIRGERMSITGPSPTQELRILEEISKAAKLTHAADAQMLLLLIPSRATVLDKPTAESDAYDRLLASLGQLPSVTYLDLRIPFREHPSPGSLYYKIDAHWSSVGIAFAAEHILLALNSSG